MSRAQKAWSVGASKAGSLLLLLCVAVSIMACGSSSKDETQSAAKQLPLSRLDPTQRIPEIVPSEALVPIQWRVVSISGPRDVVIESQQGYCVNSQSPPKYRGVAVREEGNDVYIRAFVQRPNLSEGRICRGVGYAQIGTVKIGQALSSEVKLFDAVTTPPRQRWPGK